jgi:hypothetical protein
LSHLQPTSDYCFVCGRLNPHGLHMTFFDNGVDEVYADYTVAAAYQGYPGLVHGGIVAVEAALTLADVPNELLDGADPEELGWRVDGDM